MDNYNAALELGIEDMMENGNNLEILRKVIKQDAKANLPTTQNHRKREHRAFALLDLKGRGVDFQCNSQRQPRRSARCH